VIDQISFPGESEKKREIVRIDELYLNIGKGKILRLLH